MSKLNKYVKVEDSGLLHSTLYTLSNSCSSISSQVKELKAIEREKYRVFIEARKISRALLADMKELNSHISKETKKKAAPRVSKKVKAKPKAKAKPKVAKRKKVVAAKRVAPKVEDLESLKRLKYNLDAIRNSLQYF